MPPIPLSSKQATSFDGTQVTYHTIGSEGPWVVIANGLGAGVAAWRHQIAYMGEQTRFLMWDYRGLHNPDDRDCSCRSSSSTDLVETHVKDLQAVLQAEDVRGGLWMGWSFGAQVLVQMFHTGAVRPNQLVLINPCYGRRPHDASGMRRLSPYVIDALERCPDALEQVVQRAASWPETASWLKRLGFVAATIDEDSLMDIVRHFQTVNPCAFLGALRAVASHRIDGILGRIDVPTLVILGEKDGVTPRSNAEPLAKQIPHVELFVVRHGTHFVLLEYPELLNLRVEKFLREHPR